MNVTAILDVGKTNIKLCLVGANGEIVWSRSRQNDVIEASPFPHFDVDGLWQWLLDCLAEAASSHIVEAINVSTHGACAVLVGVGDEPVLPVLDYEYSGVQACSERYDVIRPEFANTCSPNLPQGLNLGRQLFWLRERYPQEFARTTYILMYPQYWVWRLTGVAVSEVTSLGCHTDLWCPGEGAYSSLVKYLDIGQKMPAMVKANDSVGCISPELSMQTGLPARCQVYAGVHDSNASFARHLAAGLAAPFTVVSTGTWVITMTAGSDLSVLDETRDMLANVNVQGAPLACARFMGGREFEEICRLTGAGVNDGCQEREIEALVKTQNIITPAFSDSGGPFVGAAGTVPESVEHGNALATLYLALMIDYELDLLRARGGIVFGSSSVKNPSLCTVLAQLRPQQPVLLSGDTASTVSGAWCLTRAGFPALDQAGEYTQAIPSDISGLVAYRDKWRYRILDN